MPAINMELQMKFLNDLDSALDEAMAKHRFEDEKMSELRYMHAEVLRAREVIIRRLRSELVEEHGRVARSQSLNELMDGREDYRQTVAV